VLGPAIALDSVGCSTQISFESDIMHNLIGCWVLPGAGPKIHLGLDGAGDPKGFWVLHLARPRGIVGLAYAGSTIQLDPDR